MINLMPVEWIAVILAVVIIVKVVSLVVNRTFWVNKVAVPIYSHPHVGGPVFLVLALIVFYYLMQVFSIVQIFAVMGFTALIMGSGFVLYGMEFIPAMRKLVKNGFGFWVWLYAIIWVALAVWVLFEVF